MAATDPNASDTAPAPDEAEKQRIAEATRARIWDTPIGIGEPVEFDPALYKPPLSKEELEQLLEEEKS